MIRAEKGELIMIGPNFVVGAELLSIIEGVVNAHERTGVNMCKTTFECAKDIGDVPMLIKFAELMKQASEN